MVDDGGLKIHGHGLRGWGRDRGDEAAAEQEGGVGGLLGGVWRRR